MPSLSADTSTRLAPKFTGEFYSWEAIERRLAEPLELPFPVELHLMRHGETEANAHALVTGARDVLLTDRGREQARSIGRHLDRRYDVAFHSLLSRSRETLRIALEAGNVAVNHIYADPRLNERSLGVLEDTPARPIDELARGDFSYAPSGGDSYAEVTRRLLSYLLDLAGYVQDVGTRKMLVCGHMGPMRIMVGLFEELSNPIEVLAQTFRNTEVRRVEWRRLTFPAFLTGAVTARRSRV